MSSVCESEPVGALRSEPEPAAPQMAERVASAQIVVQELSKWIDSHEMNDDLDLLAHETVVSQVLPHTATQPDLRYALFFTILGDGEERAALDGVVLPEDEDGVDQDDQEADLRAGTGSRGVEGAPERAEGGRRCARA